LADPNGPNYEIVAVGTIAPTDFEQFTLPGVPYLGLYGSKDGDVNNGWPIVLHDRVDADEKHFEYIHGANHFWFTETIHFQGEGNADISRELHHEIAMGDLAGVLVRKLAVVPESTALLCDGPELAPLTAQVEILPMYRDPDRRVLDTFETVPDLFATSTGEPAFSVFPASLELPVGSQSPQLFHLGRGLFAVWLAGEEGAWGHVLPTGLDVTPWTHLSAKFLQGPLTGLNANGLDQDVRMWILDADYRLAFVPVSDFGSIPWPQFHAGGAFPSKRVYRTTRVPLAAFVDDVPDLDLTRVVATGWISDQTSAGELVFDDVEYTR
jgi:hypothetical protein